MDTGRDIIFRSSQKMAIANIYPDGDKWGIDCFGQNGETIYSPERLFPTYESAEDIAMAKMYDHGYRIAF